MPSAHVIRLSPAGPITVEGPVVASSRPVPRAAQLLVSLLPSAKRSGEVSPLSHVIARALGEQSPGFATLQEFVLALTPFAAHDAKAAIIELTARWAEAVRATEAAADDRADREELDPNAVVVSDMRRARRETGLSLLEISKKSRIPVSLLRQLEWGYMRNWPTGQYGRTELSRYARAAGLNKDMVIAAAWPLIEVEAEQRRIRDAETESSRPSVQPDAEPAPAIEPKAPATVSEFAMVSGPEPENNFAAEPDEPVVADVKLEEEVAAPPTPSPISTPPPLPMPRLPVSQPAPAAVDPFLFADDLEIRRLEPTLFADRYELGDTPRRSSKVAAAAMIGLLTAAGLWGMRFPDDGERARQSRPVVRRVPLNEPSPVESPPPTPSTSDPAVTPPQPSPVMRTVGTGGSSASVQPARLARAETSDVDGFGYSPAFESPGSAVFASPVQAATRGGDADPAGLNLRITRVVDDKSKNYHARPSPDGKRVAFDSDRDGERGVFVADADGRNLRRVSGEGFAAVPSWSPDGRQLAFARAEPDHPDVWNLWLLNVDSGDVRRLTANSSGQPWGASWFPDGQRVAYSHSNSIVVVDVASGRQTPYLSPEAKRVPRSPAVSPDGRWVIFQLAGDGGWLLDLTDRSSQRVLSDPTAEDFTWSPDGSRVAYYSRRDAAWNVWVMATR